MNSEIQVGKTKNHTPIAIKLRTSLSSRTGQWESLLIHIPKGVVIPGAWESV